MQFKKTGTLFHTQPKWVTSSKDNFSGTGDMLALFGVLVLPGIVDIFSLDTQVLDPNTNQ